ncbi:hypothetical protein [Parasphingorhabdus sp.]|uniref:hypothetical protein n=1 Tax=Parasphingorhabdus sp. TaxID=2709688 RepID=UPI003BAFDD68
MNVKICPTCGCSLVRLGITDDHAAQAIYNEIVYFFCCQGCADIFQKHPKRFVEEVRDIHVCPACLAEKPTAYTVPVLHNGQEIRFCRCPHCAEVFAKDPDFYLDRLSGKTDFKGLFDRPDAACC